MVLTRSSITGLNSALNEAVLVDAKVSPSRRILGLTFYVELAPAVGPRNPNDLYLQFLFESIGRLVVSYRIGSGWEDTAAEAIPLRAGEIGDVIRGMRYHDALFGGRFLDCPEPPTLVHWGSHLSLELEPSSSLGGMHTCDAWTEDLVIGRDTGRRPFLELRVWFEHLRIRDRSATPVAIDAVIADSKRYWQRVATAGSGGPSPYPVSFTDVPLPEE